MKILEKEQSRKEFLKNEICSNNQDFTTGERSDFREVTLQRIDLRNANLKSDINLKNVDLQSIKKY